MVGTTELAHTCLCCSTNLLSVFLSTLCLEDINESLQTKCLAADWWSRIYQRWTVNVYPLLLQVQARWLPSWSRSQKAVRWHHCWSATWRSPWRSPSGRGTCRNTSAGRRWCSCPSPSSCWWSSLLPGSSSTTSRGSDTPTHGTGTRYTHRTVNRHLNMTVKIDVEDKWKRPFKFNFLFSSCLFFPSCYHPSIWFATRNRSIFIVCAFHVSMRP